LGGVLGGATCPKTCCFELFKSAWQIRNLSDWQVKHGSSGSLVCSNANSGGASVCNNDASCTNYLGTSDDCAKVSLVGDVIQDHNQRVFRTGALNDFRKVGVGKRLRTDNNSLVSAVT